MPSVHPATLASIAVFALFQALLVAAQAEEPDTAKLLARFRGVRDAVVTQELGTNSRLQEQQRTEPTPESESSARRLQAPESKELVQCSKHGCWYGAGGVGTQTWVHGLSVTHPNIYWRCVSPGHIALTFSGGPTVHTSAILDELDKAKVVATFFIIGSQVESHPHLQRLLTRAEAAGHVIGSHGNKYKNVDGESTQDGINVVLEDIQSTVGATKHLLPRAGLRKFFRPPYLGMNAKIADVLAEHGYAVIQTSVDPKDYRAEATAKSVEERVTCSFSTNSSQHSYITLQHDTVSFTAETLKGIISVGQKRGYKFVGMDECIGLQKHLNNLCHGPPCEDITQCRSQSGHCGTGAGFCDDKSQWKPECHFSVNAACRGRPCEDRTHCRSKWGYCGTGALYCHEAPEWTPACDAGANATTMPLTTSPPTTPPHSTTPPTTPPFTTPPPTTVTTAHPTTPAPTTPHPTTAPPTTMLHPTTVPPTTASPTTALPTTAPPNTTDGEEKTPCRGLPCEDLTMCRSRWGYCGKGNVYCSYGQNPEWTPLCIDPNFNLTANDPCRGSPCKDSAHCRSMWGYCGTGSAYCNYFSMWTSQCHTN